MKKLKKKSASMTYYLMRFKGDVLLALLPLVAICGMLSAASLLTAQVFQRVFEGDLPGLVTWMLILTGAWFLVQAVSVLHELLQARAIRRLNNAVREDMAAALLHMSHQEYHGEGTGEYLSRFTNDVNQIETLAWKPFFQLVEAAATSLFSVMALLAIHWSLVLAAFLTTVVMVFVPQLFNKRMEALGAVCSEKQAKATGTFKDLLSGRDVLRSFGRESRFTD